MKSKHLVITTAPFPGEQEPQRWIIQPMDHFSVERGRLSDTYAAEEFLAKYSEHLPAVRAYPVAPGEEIGEHIHPVIRGIRPYSNGPQGEPLAPFILRSRALPEVRFETRNYPHLSPSFSGLFVAPYGDTLTPGQRDALTKAFSAELVEKIHALMPEILRGVRQQVADELRKEAKEAREAADKAEAFAATIQH